MRYLANVVTLKFVPEKCTGCGRCWEVCPHGVFVPEAKRARLADRDLCIECGACMLNCRYGAISVRSGVGCASAIICGALRGHDPTCDCGSGSSTSCCG
jgi:NAD-dependent dihydropyrimidine dehydrogenase PreA subunit